MNENDIKQAERIAVAYFKNEITTEQFFAWLPKCFGGRFVLTVKWMDENAPRLRALAGLPAFM